MPPSWCGAATPLRAHLLNFQNADHPSLPVSLDGASEHIAPLFAGQELEPGCPTWIQAEKVESRCLHVGAVAHEADAEPSEVRCFKLMGNLSPVNQYQSDRPTGCQTDRCWPEDEFPHL